MFIHRAVFGSHSFKTLTDTTVQFDQDAPITVPSWAMFPRLYVTNGIPVAVYKANVGGTATIMWRRGVWGVIGSGVTTGNCPVVFAWDGTIYVQHDASGYLSRYNLNIDFIEKVAAPYAAEGIAYVDSHGRVVMGNDPSLNQVIYGAQFWGVAECDGFKAGQCDGGDTINGSIGLAYPNGTMQMAQLGAIQIPVQLSVVNGVPRVAVSGENTPEPDALPWEPYRKYQEPAPELPPITIIPQRAIWRGSLSGVVKGNCGNELTAQHLVEDARWVTARDEPRLLALFCDTKMPEAGIQLTIELAQRNYVPVVLDDDGDLTLAESMHARFVSAGLRVIRAKQLYPRDGEDLAVYEDRINQNVTGGAIRPLYTNGGVWDEAHVAACNLAIDRMIARHTGVILDLGFGLDRHPRSAWCADYFQQLVNATPGTGPQLRQTPPPPVEKPPVVIVVPPPQKPPNPIGSLAKLWLTLKAIFGKR